MTQPLWSQRFFASTRGRIVALLRRIPMTVDQLAQALELTDNAVRAQLAGLERDGIVRPDGIKKGTSKPSVAYSLIPDVEPLLSRAYRPLLHALLDTLAERLPDREQAAVLRATGRALGRTVAMPRGDLAARLHELGGLAVAERGEDGWTIQSEGCPLSGLVRQHPRVCKAVEAMVGELVGETVREHCDRSGDRPSCRFRLGPVRTP
jgi:DeoR family transcriptional regulator, suf operon transcriptional repressor